MSTSAPRGGRPVILTFLRHYLPGYKHGGPVRTIANMAEALGDAFDIRIVTSDRDADDAEPYPGMSGGGERWIGVGKARVLYLPPDAKSLRRIARVLNATPHDVLYLNSFFDPDFTLKPLLARRLGLAPATRCVIAPRGEFSRGALRLKAAKKRAFLFAARAVGLYRDLEWHASSEYEEADIRRVIGDVARRIGIASDLPEMTPRPSSVPRPRAPGEPLRICFLSRISPMKNLDYAIAVLARVKAPVVFTIHGPRGDAAYWNRCAAAIATLPDHVTVIEAGPVEPARVVKVLSGHDLFFLPTRGENYGHVIAEALAAGLRLLISDRTPWRGLEAAGVGHDLSLDDPDAFVRAIEAEAAAIDRSETPGRIATYLADALRIEEAVAANRALFDTGIRDGA